LLTDPIFEFQWFTPQGVQVGLDTPVSFEKVPAGQYRQNEELGDPNWALNFPTPQLVHAEAAVVNPYVPGKQSLHASVFFRPFCKLNVPRGQSKHDREEFEPLWSLNVARGHS
tara:strand:+ start:135 stop:473 length:339 start_codon:yes stop_codon:yes gene_type:complete